MQDTHRMIRRKVIKAALVIRVGDRAIRIAA
jgi:hypothetical protein